MKPPPVRLLATAQLSNTLIRQTSLPRAQQILRTTITRRHASYSAPTPAYGANADMLKRRYKPKSTEEVTQVALERKASIKRVRNSAIGLVVCALAMYGAIRAYSVEPLEDTVNASGKKKSSKTSSLNTHNDAPAGLEPPASGVLEQAELVPTGTSTIPFFPRTIHLTERTATATPETTPTPSLPAGTTPPPPIITTTTSPAGDSTATGGVEYQLLGLGIRTVSILSIQVYVVGLYVASPDIAKLQEKLIRTIDPVATTLVPGEKQKLRDVLLDPVKSEEIWNDILRSGQIRTAFRIVPTRNTDLMHMRDGFVRGITARTNSTSTTTTSSNATEQQQTPEESERFGQAMNDFKSVFGGGSRKKIPYGQTLYLLRNAQGVFEAVYEDKSGVREVMGTVEEERVSRLLWLNYLAGKSVSSEEARRSVVEGAVEWTGRPVGTVATQVV